MDAGAVGVNFEDCVYDEPAALLRRSRSRPSGSPLCARRGGDLFINARTDVYLRGVGDPAARLDETLRRAAAYLAAGADGVFVPGVTDLETVRDLTASIDAPVNILAGPGAPPVSALADAGVARISLGSSIAAAAYAVADRAAHDLFGPGTYDALIDGLDYPTLNTLLS